MQFWFPVVLQKYDVFSLSNEFSDINLPPAPNPAFYFLQKSSKLDIYCTYKVEAIVDIS